MYELTDRDKIWNRACEGGGESPRCGDVALAALLLFHGLAMNGGILHAVECLSAEQLVAAEAGYRYFGHGKVGDVIAAAEQAIHLGKDLEHLEGEFDQRYWALVPDDDVLVKSFEQHQFGNPLDYSPLMK